MASLALALQVELLLHHQRSPYQDILVFCSESHGKALVLDGVTERDEFSSRMIANLLLCSHCNPRKVLVLGVGMGVSHGRWGSIPLWSLWSRSMSFKSLRSCQAWRLATPAKS